ncbi:unnamed protein product, partial [Ectocarpus fasciculatus]
MAAVGVEDMLEVGSLHVGLIAVRDVKRVNQGGVSGMLGLSPQAEPYCRFTLGEYEFTSGVGVRTTGGHSWNREQIFFPVKVPISCVVGGCGRSSYAAGSGSDGSSTNRSGGTKGPGKAATRGGQPKSGSGGGGVACGSSLLRAIAAADAGAAHGVWTQLSLRAQVFHREGGDGHGAGVGSGTTAGAGGVGKGRGGVAAKKATTVATGIITSTTATSKTKASKDTPDDPTGTTLMGGDTPAAVDSGGGGGGVNDRLLGECSLNLVEVVSGRAPHVEEWVPLDSEGELRLSLDYDSVGELPVPGDSV